MQDNYCKNYGKNLKMYKFENREGTTLKNSEGKQYLKWLKFSRINVDIDDVSNSIVCCMLYRTIIVLRIQR